MRVRLGCILILAAFAGPLRAADESLWAFRPIARPAVPGSSPAHPIDAFLAAARANAGLTVAPEADRRTLLRRLTFDLTGLPPAPEEVQAFLADTRPDAYERLVDRLLSSPRYGERQARHWLDLVRYAETHGYERDDPKPDAWRYRDWVVDAFNADLPYDRFVIDQLAGDERPGADVASKTATGFYRLGLIDDEPADVDMDRFDQLDDMVRTVGTAFLGLTIHCARCHDHKFDPISQQDYYRFVAFFAPGERYKRGDSDSITVDLADEAQIRRVKVLEEAVEARLRELRTRRSKAGEGDRKRQLEREIRELERNKPVQLPTVLGLTDAGPTAEPTKLLIRGDAHRPGEVVEPGFLQILDARSPATTPPPDGKTTGRRLALARWIASPENPLTARVMVNRLWQQHFGRGLVGTPSDFGAMGEEPEVPELLDWLASEFITRGWGVKAMHRLIVTSAAYRQGGGWNESAATTDPAHAFHWRMPPRRLEAEAIRDAALAVAGVLDPTPGGPSVRPPIDRAVLAGQSVPGRGWAVSKGDAIYRRSIYVYVKRTLPLPELEVLDAPSPDEPCPRRSVTTTAPQALTFLNGAFWHDVASRFADRLRREAGTDPKDQMALAFRLAFQREASESELARAVAFLRSQASLIGERPDPAGRADPDAEALRAFCLVILNANEFVTVD